MKSVRTRPSEKRPVGRPGKVTPYGSYHARVSSRPRSPRFPVSAYESPNTHTGDDCLPALLSQPLPLPLPLPPLLASPSSLCLRSASAAGVLVNAVGPASCHDS